MAQFSKIVGKTRNEAAWGMMRNDTQIKTNIAS